MYAFYVVMQKRRDGKVYADLHKTNGKVYLDKRDALQAWRALGEMSSYTHVVELFAVTAIEDVYPIGKVEA